MSSSNLARIFSINYQSYAKHIYIKIKIKIVLVITGQEYNTEEIECTAYTVFKIRARNHKGGGDCYHYILLSFSVH